MKFEVVNELTLKVEANQGDVLFSKAGAWIAGESFGGKTWKMEKVLLGPQGNPLQAALGQLGRRFTGENLPLMKMTATGQSIQYYANDQQHVVVYKLGQGERISVESENILAFTPDCNYSIRFLAQGVISQKGLATSTLTGVGPNAYVAVIIDGNPIVLDNTQNGETITVDPDAVVCWVGADPGFKLDISWKNIIGQASGESYFFEFNNPATVIIQPQERKSGLDISMDGKKTGSKPQMQNNQTLGGATRNVGSATQSAGNMLNQLGGILGGGGGNGNPPAGGGLGGMIGGLFG